MVQLDIELTWDTEDIITNDIASFIQQCEETGGDELKEKVIKAILEGINLSK